MIITFRTPAKLEPSVSPGGHPTIRRLNMSDALPDETLLFERVVAGVRKVTV